MAKRISKKTLIVRTQYGPFRCLFVPELDMGGYAVEAQGLAGALSWGKNLAEAKRMIVEAIEGAVEAKIIAQAERKGIIQVIQSKQHARAL